MYHSQCRATVLESAKTEVHKPQCSVYSKRGIRSVKVTEHGFLNKMTNMTSDIIDFISTVTLEHNLNMKGKLSYK